MISNPSWCKCDFDSSPEIQRTFPPMRLGTRTAVQAIRLGVTDQVNWAQLGGRSGPAPETSIPHLDRAVTGGITQIMTLT